MVLAEKRQTAADCRQHGFWRSLPDTSGSFTSSWHLHPWRASVARILSGSEDGLVLREVIFLCKWIPRIFYCEFLQRIKVISFFSILAVLYRALQWDQHHHVNQRYLQSFYAPSLHYKPCSSFQFSPWPWQPQGHNLDSGTSLSIFVQGMSMLGQPSTGNSWILFQPVHLASFLCGTCLWSLHSRYCSHPVPCSC